MTTELRGDDMPGEVQIDDLRFKGINSDKRIALFKDGGFAEDSLPPAYSSLFAIANKTGYFAAAGPRSFVLGKTQNLRQAFFADDSTPYNPDLEAPLSSPVTHVAFTASELHLILGHANGTIIAYNLDSLRSGSDSDKIELNIGSELRELKPNPQLPHLVACLSSNGQIRIIDMNTRGFLKNAEGSEILHSNVSTTAWSKMGKQIMCGMLDGSGWQMTPEGEGKAVLPAPPGLEGYYMSSIAWLENHLFITSYTKPPPTDDTESMFFTMKRDKTNHIFEKLLEPAPPYGLERGPPAFMHTAIREYPPNLMDMVMFTGSCASGVGIVARFSRELPEVPVNTFMTVSPSDDTRRADMPLSVSDGDTSPIGMALDLSSRDPVRRPTNNEEIDESPGPLPIVMVLNHEGKLCAWHVIYEEAITTGNKYPGMAVYSEEQPTQAAQTPAQTPRQPASPFAARTQLGSPFTQASNTNVSSGSIFGGDKPSGTTNAFGSNAPSSSNAFNQPSVLGSPFSGASTSSPSTISAFGQASTIGGGTAFGQGGALGAKPSPWGSASTSTPTASTSAFGKSAFGQSSTTSAFGTPAASSSTSTFGAPAASTTTSAFGQSTSTPSTTTPAFAKPTFGQTSAFGAPATPAKPAFGAPAPLGAAPAFGQASAFGSAPAAKPAAFSSSTVSSGFGAYATKGGFAAAANAPASSPFGSGSGLQSSGPSAFGTGGGLKSSTTSAFGGLSSSGSAFGSGASLGGNGFKLGSTFQADSSQAEKDDNPSSGASGSFGFGGMGLGNVLNSASTAPRASSPTADNDSDMEDDNDDSDDEKPKAPAPRPSAFSGFGTPAKADNPFTNTPKPAEGTPQSASNPFAAVTTPAKNAANPFAAQPPPSGITPSKVVNPFAASTSSASPFANAASGPSPFAKSAAANPFASSINSSSPFGKPTAANPFAASTSSPFATAGASSPSPFAKVVSPSPFAAASKSPAPIDDSPPASPPEDAPLPPDFTTVKKEPETSTLGVEKSIPTSSPFPEKTPTPELEAEPEEAPLPPDFTTPKKEATPIKEAVPLPDDSDDEDEEEFKAEEPEDAPLPPDFTTPAKKSGSSESVETPKSIFDAESKAKASTSSFFSQNSSKSPFGDVKFSPSPVPGTLSSSVFGEQKIDESQPFASFFKNKPEDLPSDEDEEDEDEDEEDEEDEEEEYDSQEDEEDEREEGEFDSDDVGEFDNASDEEADEEDSEEEIDLKDPKTMHMLGSLQKGSSVMPSTKSKGHVGKSVPVKTKTPEAKKTAGGLFSLGGKKEEKPAVSSGLFGFGSKTEEKKSAPATGGSIFGNSQKETTNFNLPLKKEEEKKPSDGTLFGSSTTSLGGGFLGGLGQKKEELKEQKSATGLFNADSPTKPTTGIFGAKSASGTASPFASQPAKTGGLFSQPPPSSPKPAAAPAPVAPVKKPEPTPEPENFVTYEDEELRDEIQNTPVKPFAELRPMRKLVEEEVPEDFNELFDSLFLSGNNMLNTLGLISRDIKAYNLHQSTPSTPPHTLDTPIDPKNLTSWTLHDTSLLSNITDSLSTKLKSLSTPLPSVQPKLDSAASKHIRLTTSMTEAHRLLAIQLDPTAAAASRARLLPPEQQLQQRKLRKQFARIDKLMKDAESEVAVLKAKAGSRRAGAKVQRPKLENLQGTVLKMGAMLRQKRDEVEMLEERLRRVRMRSTTPSAARERSVSVTPGAARFGTPERGTPMGRENTPFRTPLNGRRGSGTPGSVGSNSSRWTPGVSVLERGMKALDVIEEKDLRDVKEVKQRRRENAVRLREALGKRGARVTVGEN